MLTSKAPRRAEQPDAEVVAVFDDAAMSGHSQTTPSTRRRSPQRTIRNSIAYWQVDDLSDPRRRGIHAYGPPGSSSRASRHRHQRWVSQGAKRSRADTQHAGMDLDEELFVEDLREKSR